MTAKQFDEIEVSEWNVNHFFGYMNKLTVDKFGVNYAPMRSWNFERGLIGGIIGTKKKAGTHDKELVKAFIDLTFSEYKASAQYPAPMFGFVWTYRQGDLQRVQLTIRNQQLTEQATEEVKSDSIDDWLLS